MISALPPHPPIAMDLFEYWSQPLVDGAIHPDDVPVLSAHPDHNFFLGEPHSPMPPGHINGPLKTAPIVLCYGNPGYSNDEHTIAATPSWRRRLDLQRSGTEDLPIELPGWRSWFEPRLRTIGPLLEELKDKVAVFNVVPYSSREMTGLQERVAVGLPSVWAAQKHLREALIPKAREGEIFLVIMRKFHLWGVAEGIQCRTLQLSSNRRGGHLVELGAEIGTWLTSKD